MTRLDTKKEYRPRYIGIRLSEEEYNTVRIKALLYTEGIVSEYIRFSAINYTPIKEDIKKEGPNQKAPSTNNI